MANLSQVIQELSPTMLVCLDSVSGTILFHNPAFAEKLRYESAQILEHTIFQFVDENSFIPLAKALKSVTPGSERTLRVTLTKGNQETFETELQVCRRGSDDFLLYLFFTDITAKIRKDETLEVFQQIISSSKELIVLVGTDYCFQVVNPSFLRNTGLQEAEVLGRSVHQVHQEDADEIIKRLDETISTQKAQRFMAKMVHPTSRKTVCIDSILSPYRNDKGEVVGVIVCARDVTAYMKTNQAVSSSNRYYKTLFEYSPDLLASVNLQTGMILDANRTLLSVLGYEERELKGQHIFKFHSQAHKKTLAEAIVNLSNNHPIQSLEVSLLSKEGSCISADLRTTPIVDQDSSIAIFVWRDTRYQEKLAFKAAHDPLTHLLNRSGFMPLLESPFEDGEQRTLCFIDIDNFKILNDTSGHLCGDEFLIAMSDLLQQSISGSDRLCRLGGDEFLILLHNRELSEAHKLMRVILLKINALIKGDRKFLNAKLGVSIGVTPFEQGESSRAVLKRADQACYQSKKNGKNQISILDSGVTS